MNGLLILVLDWTQWDGGRDGMSSDVSMEVVTPDLGSEL